jgi:atrial natriuretic peptide receptor A
MGDFENTCILCIYVFTGVAGQVTIDANGDRIADYSLLDMDPNTSSFVVSAALSYIQSSSLAFRMKVC